MGEAGGGARNQFEGGAHNVIQAANIDTLVTHYHGELDREVAALNALPATIAYFTNRELVFGWIDSAVAAPREKATPAILVFSGLPGAGRKAAALRWAHANADLFPDGCLYVDCSVLASRGSAGLSDLLASLLRQIGVPEEDIRGFPGDRSALWRKHTAGRKLLIVLADVQLLGQVEQFLPASRDAVVLITTDHDLGSSLDRYGAIRLSVGPLDGEACKELLGKMVGLERMAAEPEAVNALLELCEGWPEALHRAGSWLKQRPGREIAAAARRLRKDRRWNRGEGGERTMTAVSDAAYESLSAKARRAYRLLGLHPAASDRPGHAVSGVSFTLLAAAALLGTSEDEAADDLETLLDWGLITEENGRYRLYDRVRRHAFGKAWEMPEEERERAVRHVIEWYLAAATYADLTVNPYREPVVRIHDPQRHPFGRGEEGRRRGLRWLETEHPNLCACLYAAADRGWDDLVVQLCDAQWALQLSIRPYGTLVPALKQGMESARHLAEDRWIFQMAIRLGRAYFETDQFQEAHVLLDEALGAARSSGRRLDEATGSEFRGRAHLDKGEYAKALEYFTRALEIEESEGRLRGVAINLHHSARALLKMDRAEEAIEKCEIAYERFGQALNRDNELEPDRYNQGRVSMTLGRCHLEAGQPEQGRAVLLRALDIMRAENRPYQEAKTLEELADMEYGDRMMYLTQAIEIYERIGSVRAKELRGEL